MTEKKILEVVQAYLEVEDDTECYDEDSDLSWESGNYFETSTEALSYADEIKKMLLDRKK